MESQGLVLDLRRWSSQNEGYRREHAGLLSVWNTGDRFFQYIQNDYKRLNEWSTGASVWKLTFPREGARGLGDEA